MCVLSTYDPSCTDYEYFLHMIRINAQNVCTFQHMIVLCTECVHFLHMIRIKRTECIAQNVSTFYICSVLTHRMYVLSTYDTVLCTECEYFLHMCTFRINAQNVSTFYICTECFVLTHRMCVLSTYVPY